MKSQGFFGGGGVGGFEGGLALSTLPLTNRIGGGGGGGGGGVLSFPIFVLRFGVNDLDAFPYLSRGRWWWWRWYYCLWWLRFFLGHKEGSVDIYWFNYNDFAGFFDYSLIETTEKKYYK